MLQAMMNPSDSLGELIDQLTSQAQSHFATQELPSVVVSPYRFNPLGAHIDHQGGTVLARTLNQYSVGAYYANNDATMQVLSAAYPLRPASFQIGDKPSGENWHRYAMAAAAAFKRWAALPEESVRGAKLIVQGTLVGAGLSSSASIILAYITVLSEVNGVSLTVANKVELCRQVENEHMGLNNGVQDQMSIVYGRRDALSSLQMDTVTADYWKDPDTLSEVNWLVCYSGFSRELIASGFNERVSECREAAQSLHAGAKRLGDVPFSARGVDSIAALPQPLARRTRHVYSEMHRVADAKAAWLQGDWPAFGALMNASCRSSIEDYECGSEPMQRLQNFALETPGIFGSRFSGGGYGGCLIMLVNSLESNDAAEQIFNAYLSAFPEKRDVASIFIAKPEAAVRIL